jgi:hypothetical protein
LNQREEERGNTGEYICNISIQTIYQNVQSLRNIREILRLQSKANFLLFARKARLVYTIQYNKVHGSVCVGG